MSEIPRGAVLGVLGGGQLGRMFVIAAQRLGYRVAVLAASPGSPAGQLADLETCGNLDSVATVLAFAESVSGLTFENEHFHPATLRAAAGVTVVRPQAAVLRRTGDRLEQRAFLAEVGADVAPFAAIREPADLVRAASLGIFPAYLKTARNGYDGRGQVEVGCFREAVEAWQRFGRAPAILEKRIELQAEFSVIVARSGPGETAVYDPIRNVHRDGILDASTCPAGLSAEAERTGRESALRIAERLDLEGVLCVEFFLDECDRVLVNEIAARPHNSGHLTIEASETSQFEQQVRVLAGLPLGSARLVSAAAMVNIFQSVPSGSRPVEEVTPGVFLHRYGKEPRAGRKVGHITALRRANGSALGRALALRTGLSVESEHACAEFSTACPVPHGRACP